MRIKVFRIFKISVYILNKERKKMNDKKSIWKDFRKVKKKIFSIKKENRILISW